MEDKKEDLSLGAQVRKRQLEARMNPDDRLEKMQTNNFKSEMESVTKAMLENNRREMNKFKNSVLDSMESMTQKTKPLSKEETDDKNYHPNTWFRKDKGGFDLG